MGNDRASILLLGGSSQQVVAIEAAKRLGYRTVLCDYLPDNPGQHVADVFYRESTTDRDRMLEVARREGVSGVLAYASDPAASSAAYVAEALGLPTNPLSAVETLGDKGRFRAHLRDNGLPCPGFITLDVASCSEVASRALRALAYPVVVKPTDSSGSRGVSVVDEFDPSALKQALAHAKAHSRNGVLLAEERIAASFPRVVGGDVFVVDGQVRFWGLMSCLRDQALGGLVPTGERYPAGLDATQEQAVRACIQNLVESLGLRFGEFNVEVILGAGDVPYVLELGARAGGNMIPVQLSDVSGIDLVEANVLFAMGKAAPSLAFDGNDACVATYVLHAREAGVFKGVSLSPGIKPFIYRTALYAQPGEQVERFDAANKALGIVFLRFGDEAQMERRLQTITDDITVEVERAESR